MECDDDERLGWRGLVVGVDVTVIPDEIDRRRRLPDLGDAGLALARETSVQARPPPETVMVCPPRGPGRRDEREEEIAGRAH